MAGTTAITAIHFDLGDGTVKDSPVTQGWGCPTSSREVSDGISAHVYGSPGVYRISVTVTAVPSTIH